MDVFSLLNEDPPGLGSSNTLSDPLKKNMSHLKVTKKFKYTLLEMAWCKLFLSNWKKDKNYLAYIHIKESFIFLE